MRSVVVAPSSSKNLGLNVVQHLSSQERVMGKGKEYMAMGSKGGGALRVDVAIP